MSGQNTTNPENLERREGNTTAQKLGGMAWGLFFIWVGIVMLMEVGPGIGLLGVGVITLGSQGARRYFGLEFEGAWVVVGLLFLLGGICKLFGTDLPLVPAVLILAGLAVLVATVRGRGQPKNG